MTEVDEGGLRNREGFMSPVLVLIERDASGAGVSGSPGIRKASLELVTLARRLGEPVAVVCGAGDAAAEESIVDILSRYGATAVYLVQAGERDEYLVVPKVEALAEVAGRVAPVAVLVSSGPEGKEVAARLAVRLDAGIITDAVDVTPGPDGPVATQSVFAGSWMVSSRVRRGPAVITVRPNAVSAEPAPTGAEVVGIDGGVSDLARATRVVSRTPKAASERPELVDADIVVAGGRGVGSAEGFALIEQLADALGGAVGASRGATELSWCSHDLQIGQTGTTVTPRLYVAAGISGAIQHRVGMQSSRTIVAVNKDPKAPIFSIADFGVVGDLHTVVPALINEISKRKG
jgi:electron transfer flavoprotein alpha subunit